MSCLRSRVSRSYLRIVWSTLNTPALLPFLYQTHKIQRRPLHYSPTTTRQSPIRTVLVGGNGASNSSRDPQVFAERRDSDESSPRGEVDRATKSKRLGRIGQFKLRKVHAVIRTNRDGTEIDSLEPQQNPDRTTASRSDRRLDFLSRAGPPDMVTDSAELRTHPSAAREDADSTATSERREGQRQSISRRHYAGTMTDGEREAFAKLFRSLNAKEKPEPSEDEQEDAGGFGPSLATDVAQIHGGESLDRRIETILDRELRGEESNISRYPDTIRGMAVTARLQLARDKLLQQQKTDQAGLTAEADEEIRRVWKLMVNAGSDVAIWNVLEDEVFTPFLRLGLDKQPARDAETEGRQVITQDQGSESGQPDPGQQDSGLALIARTYPHNLYNAARMLCKRAAYTPLVSSILPACKSLGVSSFVLGISTGLYNELLEHSWRVMNDMSSMLLLLREMDDAALTLDNGTWMVLEYTTLYRYRALRGDFGEGVRTMEGMSERMRQGKQLWYWKKEIKKRTEEAVLESTRGNGIQEGSEEYDDADLPQGLPFEHRAISSAAAG